MNRSKYHNDRVKQSGRSGKSIAARNKFDRVERAKNSSLPARLKFLWIEKIKGR